MVKILKENKVYLPLSPSKFVNKEVIDALCIIMSCGGGMGGSKWREYVEPCHIKDGLNEVHDIVDNKDIILNSNFIVEIEKVKLVKTTVIHNNENFKNTLGVPIDYWYVYYGNEDIEFVNEYKYEFCK